MKWRDSAGMTIAVLALLGLGAQPIARWMVARAVSQYVPGTATIAGSVTWDPARHVWTCHDLRLDADGHQAVNAVRATFQLDSKALFRRDLVIDSARVDGMVVHAPKSQPELGNEQRVVSAFPTFSPDVWGDTLLHQQKSEVLSASQRHEIRHLELLKQLDSLRARCEGIKAATSPNPLRNRSEIREVRRDVANLLQALAEERIQIRETDRALERTTVRLQDAWREDLSQSITDQLPQTPELVQELAVCYLAQYWESRRFLMRCASATAAPLQEREFSTRGSEVRIPGLPRNHLVIRSATLAGSIQAEDEPPIRFRAEITGWGDASSAIDPRSDWRFEMDGNKTTSKIQAHVERAACTNSSASEIPQGFLLTWTEHANPELTSRGIWKTTSDGDRIDLSVPVDSIADMSRSGPSIAFEGKTDWESCWISAIEKFRGRYLNASLPLTHAHPAGTTDFWQCRNPEVSPESLTLLTQAWEETLAAYVARMSQRMQSRVEGLHRAMEQFRTQRWSPAQRDHLESLAKLEREALWLRERCEEFGNVNDRLARMRIGSDDW
jgi:ribosomal protein L29